MVAGAFFTEGNNVPLIFSFQYYSTTKKRGLHLLGRDMEEKFFQRIGEFEQKTMPMIQQMGRERGFSPERMENSNYELLKATYMDLDNFYHFRIKQTELVRVFIGTDGLSNIIYVLFIDSKGEINH